MECKVERIIAKNGKLHFVNDSESGTNVYSIKLPKGSYDWKFVNERNKKVSQLVKSHKATFGINFPFVWDGHILGDSKNETGIISKGYGKMLKWHSFVKKNGETKIGVFNVNDPLITDQVQSAPLLIENGRLVWDFYNTYQQVANDIGRDTRGNLIRCQRTFLGIDAEEALYVFVSDGRTSSNIGLTLEEMALYAQYRGCDWAVNGDGGGSSIVSDQTGGLNQSLNTGSNERIVHHALLFFVKNAPDKISFVKDSPKKDEDKMSRVKVTVGVYVDGKFVGEAEGELGEENKTMVWIRDVGNLTGAVVGWDQENKRATLHYKSK